MGFLQVEPCAEYILYNGTIITMDEGNPKASAVAIGDGKILKTFKDGAGEIKRSFSTRMIDLKGRTVLPGLIDNNVHLVQGGLRRYCIEIYADHQDDFLHQLKKKVSEFADGELVWCIGYNEEICNISRWDLDKVSPSHPIVISKTEFHKTIVNTMAYNLLKIPSHVPGIRKNEDGIPTGVLDGEASGFARRKLYTNFVSDGLRTRALQYMEKELLANGITTVNAMEGGPFFSDRDISVTEAFGKQSRVDVLLFPQTMDVEHVLEMGMKRIGGNIYLDGSISSATAALELPYENSDQKGALYYSQERVDQFIMQAHSSGLQISVSCIGTRAIEQALCAFVKAFQLFGKGNHRHRLELFVLPTREQIQKAIGLGLILSMRPNYDAIMGGEGPRENHKSKKLQCGQD